VGFQGRCPWLISAVPAGRSIAECGMREPAAGGSCCAGRAAERPGRSRSPFLRSKVSLIDVSMTSPAISAR